MTRKDAILVTLLTSGVLAATLVLPPAEASTRRACANKYCHFDHCDNVTGWNCAGDVGCAGSKCEKT